MPSNRPRRIVRWVLLTLTAVVLLPFWYVGAWLVVSRADCGGHISPAFVQKLRPAFVPLLTYCSSDLPGSRTLCRIWWRVNPPMFTEVQSGYVTFIAEVASQLAPPPPDGRAEITIALPGRLGRFLD
jgi:hypothetical protein